MEQDLLRIDRLALSHGQARWVLSYLGLHAGEDEKTFDAYIKSLRRDGVPFARDELGVGAGHNLTYGYPHLMELAVALALRTQGILSRHIVALLAQHRSILRSHYRRAWLERNTGLGASREVVIDGTTERRISGTYLALHLDYTARGRPARDRAQARRSLRCVRRIHGASSIGIPTPTPADFADCRRYR